jgi:hypothetical protein
MSERIVFDRLPGRRQWCCMGRAQPCGASQMETPDRDLMAFQWAMQLMTRAFRDRAASCASIDPALADEAVARIEIMVAREMDMLLQKPVDGVTVPEMRTAIAEMRAAIGEMRATITEAIAPLREMTQTARDLIQQAGQAKH